MTSPSWAERVGEGLTDGGVAVGNEVVELLVCLLARAELRGAGHALAIGRLEPSRQVDDAVDAGQVPGGTETAERAKVTEAVLGQEHARGDTCVRADEACENESKFMKEHDEGSTYRQHRLRSCSWRQTHHNRYGPTHGHPTVD
jgi:hypothetical protein